MAREPETFLFPRRKDSNWRRTALFTVTAAQAVNVLYALEQTDLQLIRDIGVVAGLDLEISEHAPVPPSGWAIKAKDIGERAVSELIERICHPQAPAMSVRMAMDFVDRGTV